MNTQLETLCLVTFDKENKEHVIFLKKLMSDKTVTQRFTGFLSRLNAKSNNILGKAFFLYENNEIIGFIDIGSFNKEENCVYLRGAIDKEKRGNNYGHRMLNEVSNYIFANHPEVASIKLKIDTDNYSSIKTAESCNFINFFNGYYIKNNPYVKKTLK